VLTNAGRHGFPSPAEVPALMGDFAHWLRAARRATAFEAHRRLVDIHPFNDGSGRTARLLMDLILIRCGYPAVAVRPKDRVRTRRPASGAGRARTKRSDSCFTSGWMPRWKSP
jgi:Fic family protein